MYSTTLREEYRESMDADVLHAWAKDVCLVLEDLDYWIEDTESKAPSTVVAHVGRLKAYLNHIEKKE